MVELKTLKYLDWDFKSGDEVAFLNGRLMRLSKDYLTAFEKINFRFSNDFFCLVCSKWSARSKLSKNYCSHYLPKGDSNKNTLEPANCGECGNCQIEGAEKILKHIFNIKDSDFNPVEKCDSKTIHTKAITKIEDGDTI